MASADFSPDAGSSGPGEKDRTQESAHCRDQIDCQLHAIVEQLTVDHRIHGGFLSRNRFVRFPRGGCLPGRPLGTTLHDNRGDCLY